MNPVAVVHFFAYVYVCVASANPCNKDAALWENTSGGTGFTSKEVCVEYGKHMFPPFNKADGFVFDGEKLKFHIECTKSVDT